MSTDAAAARIATVATEETRAESRGLSAIEDWALSVTLAAMVLLPLAEIVLRRTLRTGVEGAPLIVQHLALVAGMLGGAVAAREGRMLALSTLGDSYLRGRWKAIARIAGGSVGGTVAAFLSIASYQFVEAERPFSKVLVYGIPVWVVELALPIGFALIAARLVYRGSDQGMRAVKHVAIAQVPGVSDHDFSAVPIILRQLRSRMNMEGDAPRYFRPIERHADRCEKPCDHALKIRV